MFLKKSLPALVLLIVSPIFGELFSGSSPLNEFCVPFSTIVFLMLYGAGAILIREFVIRLKKGWFSLLLLGMAYGIYEEGLVVRSFFDPNWMDLDALATYGRAAGANWVWIEYLTHFHALFSIAAAILFVEVLFPTRRHEPWVGRGVILTCILAFTVMLPLGALLNPYDTPDIWLAVSWLAIVVLVLLAWRLPSGPLLPQWQPRHRPGWMSHLFWLLAFLGSFIYVFVIYSTAENQSPHFLITMLLLVGIDLLGLLLVLWASGLGRAWDDRHRLALVNGGLAFWLLIGMLVNDNPLLRLTHPVYLILLGLIALFVHRRVKHETQAAAVLPKVPQIP